MTNLGEKLTGFLEKKFQLIFLFSINFIIFEKDEEGNHQFKY